MNKKIRLFMSLSIVAASAACFATVLSTRNANVLGITKADDPEYNYTLDINCASDIGSVNSDFTVNTTSGNPLTFHVNNNFTKVGEGLQFSGTGGIIHCVDGFQSLYSITIQTKDNGFQYNNIQVLGRNSPNEFAAFSAKKAGEEILFSKLDGNKYFSISAATNSGSNIITTITLKYKCI